MVPVNVVVIAGRVAAEPVQRQLPSGDRVIEFRVAVPEEGRRRLPLPVTVWDPPEGPGGCGDITRDDPVLVCGRLVRRFYRSGAGARSLTEIVATNIRRLTEGDRADPSA